MVGNLVSESELGGEFIRIPNLRRFAYIFAPNETYQLNQTARTLAFIAVTGDLVLSINGGPEIPVFQGITYKMPEGFFFSQLRFRENNGSTASFTIDISNGDIIDARSSTSGDTPVVNAASPNDSLRVDTLATDPGLVALASSVKGGKTLADVITDLTVALQASQDLRARLTTLQGATHAKHSNTSGQITVVSAAANTSGIIVRMAVAIGESDNPAYYAAGANNIFCGFDGQGDGSAFIDRVQNIFIPANTALLANFINNSRVGHIWFEVL